MKAAYISDLHIEFLKNNWQKKNQKEISVESIADLFILSFNKIDCGFGVIAGDISHCKEDNVKFLKHIDANISKPIYVTLGNHDYWDWHSSFDPSVKYEDRHKWRGMSIEAQEAWYSKQLSGCNRIRLLITDKILTEAGSKYLTENLGRNDLLWIIGDCGFSAYNPQFNASNGIYRDALRFREKERDYCDRFRTYYSNIVFQINEANKERGRNDKLLVITHTPIGDWGGYTIEEDNVFYICGHVHDCHHNEAEIVATDRYKGDAGNGYNKSDFEFKTLEIK